MKLLEIIQPVLEAKTITPDVESQIRRMLCARKLEQIEVDALVQLSRVMQDGTVKYAAKVTHP